MSTLRRGLFVGIAAAMCLWAVPAMSAQQDFHLHNDSGKEMKALYVSPTSEDHWGEDILGQDTLAEGGTVEVHFDREETECNWDVKAEFEDGSDLEVHNVNFCEVSEVTITPGGGGE